MRRTSWILLAVLLLLGLAPLNVSAQAPWSSEGAEEITSIAVSADGSRVAMGSHGSKAAVFDQEGRVLFEVEAGNVVNAVDLLEDGTLLAASDDRHLYAYGPDGHLLWDRDFKHQVKSVSASSDGALVTAVVQRGKAVIQVDAATGEQTGSFPGDTILKTAEVSADGSWIAAAGADQFIFLLDKDGQPHSRFGAGGQVQSLAVTGEGDVAVGTDTRQVELFNKEGTRIQSLSTRDHVSAVAFSKDGKLLGVADLSGFFYLFDSNGSKLWESGGGQVGRALAFSPDGTILYAGQTDGSIRPLDVGSVIAEGKSQTRMRTAYWTAGALAIGLLLTGWLFYLKKQKRLVVFKSIWHSRWVYLGLLPSFALLFTFMYFPAFSGLFHSLYQWQPGGKTTFIGLANFERMIHDPYVSKGLGNLILLIVTGLVKALIPPLIVAELIYHLRSKKLQYGFRTAFTASMVIPGVAGLLIWQNFYDPNMGLFNHFLQLIGLGSWTHGWLGDPQTALWSLIFIGFPFVGILQLLVLYAGLLSIPLELMESARMDGAGLPRIIRSIHLPLLAGQFKFLIIMGLIGIIQDFNGILIVTGGGPMDSTYVPALQMYYAATKFNDLGYASALGVSMFAVILVITIINLKFIKQSDE
ncbi:ABC transporter permease subunit [Paenibacillus silagei]|uniref:ABC-type sugar transport system permease subunit/WD40 repeat protein n=1 Tax=Paenibacillus silagei TaxID=1670801 RepID=A0ABS4NKM9_9BACL|nr:ABC transporter permease subunit [Paenibacillus silagei]MBP2110603.1 ABC-type sugar transport system permease subunit/WD40 repeat protein [Paenibacillus silagei]